MELLDLYDPAATAILPPTMTQYPGLTSSKPLVPINIAPKDNTARISALVEPTDVPPSRPRFQPSAPRPGVEAILGRDHPQPSLGLAATAPTTDPTASSAAPPKKPGHVTQSSRDFWSGSAVLAAAERPNHTAPPSERRPLPLKPRTVATTDRADRAPSPNGHPTEKPQQQPYWSRTNARGAADSNSNWRGGAAPNSSVASGGVKYPGASADEITLGDRPPASAVTVSQNPRKSTGDLMGPAPHFAHPANTAAGGRSTFARDGGGLFGRNNKESLKPTNTRDLSALTKGSSRDPGVASHPPHHDRDARESRHHGPANAPSKSQSEDAEEMVWFYRDPQGNVQGAFSEKQLLQWENDGYYDAELPVSKSRDHGFKPMAIAFGLRKDEPPAASPPPGFKNNATPSKKETTGGASPMSMRPSREERNRRGTRTVEEMAEEVEMMRLQARNKRIEQKGTAQAGNNAQAKEKAFFDTDDQSSSKANDHRVTDKPLEDSRVDGTMKSEPDTDNSSEKTKPPVVSSTIASISVNEAVQPDPPISQSRFASFMKQDANPVENKSLHLPSGNDLTSGQGTPTAQLQTPHAVDELVAKAEIGRGVKENPEEAGRGDVQSPGTDVATAWTSMMMGLQQQQSQQQQGTAAPSMPVMPTTMPEQDLMAIDPAIAHASFSRPTIQASSPVTSPRASSSELPPWLHFSGGESNNRVQTHEPLHDSTQALQTQSAGQVPLSAHMTSHEQAQLQAQAQARAQAEARARAELIRQAQVQAQVQARQLQAQQQAQARAAQHATAMAQAQARANPQEQLWMLRHRLNQLQATYDGTYRAHLETTRTMQAAQAAISSSLSGSHENQNARAVLAQATTVLKEQALQLERIKSAAQSTHSLILQHSMAAAHGQQQRQTHAQSSLPSPEAHGNVSPRSLSQADAHSPKQPLGNGMPLVGTPARISTPEGPNTPVGGPTLIGIAEQRMEDSQQSTRRNLNSSYDALNTNEQDGWEKVSRKAKAGVAESTEDPVNEVIAKASQTREVDPAERKHPREEGIPIPVGAGKVANGGFDTDPESRNIRVQEADSHEIVVNGAKSVRTHNDAAPAVAPWSKTAAAQGSGNGLSLREIQRQEELRSKAEEKTVVAQQERDEATKAAAARWNSGGQPWGGAGDPTKQQTLSFKEKMRFEEEQKKRSASHLTRETGMPVPGHPPAASARPLTTKTGWASLVAKNNKPPQVRKPAATVVGKRMDEEPPFWGSVAPQSQSIVANSARPARQSFADSASQPSHPAPPSRVVAAKAPAAPSAVPKKTTTQTKANKGEARDSSPSGEDTVIGRRVSNEFANWCSENLKKLTGNKIQDTVMFDYLVAIKSPSEIQDTILQNLGANDKTRSFADEFIRRLEFERSSVVADAGASGTGGRKKGRRHRAAKVDPSLVLGFTSTSSRIMQGTIEMPEMK